MRISIVFRVDGDLAEKGGKCEPTVPNLCFCTHKQTHTPAGGFQTSAPVERRLYAPTVSATLSVKESTAARQNSHEYNS